MKQLFLLQSMISIILFCTFHTSQAQTYMYKRIMIVENNNKKKMNDDVHYITFNSKGCYESNEKGISENEYKFMKFIKKENNLHCYYGNGFFGNAYYYFSSDYSRLNIKLNYSTYVYIRVVSSEATASLRIKQKIMSTNNMFILPTSSKNADSNSKKHSTKTHRNKCNYCDETGIDPSPTYGPNYTGKSNSIYCKICHTIKDNHYHAKCPSCGGKGYYETRY